MFNDTTTYNSLSFSLSLSLYDHRDFSSKFSITVLASRYITFSRVHENHLDGQFRECSRRGATRGVARSTISDAEVLKPTTAAAVSQFVARDRIMSLLRGVFTRHRDHVVCHTDELGALEFQLRRNETMHICILRRIIRESGCRTRGGECLPRLYYGESGLRSWEAAGHHRHLVWNRIAIHPRYEYRERILRFRPRIVEGKAGIIYEVERGAPVREVLRKRKLHIELFP